MSTYKRDIAQAMRDYLPTYYAEINEVRAILGAEAKALDRLNSDIADLLAQYSIETATWGLTNWERLVGVKTDTNKPIDQRRSVVRAKLRGVGTVTVALIKNVAESYDYGAVEVTEQSAQYTITVRFASNYGVPSNLDDIRKALRDIVPAHLAIDFEFKFVTYAQVKATYAAYSNLKAAGKTYAQLLNGE